MAGAFRNYEANLLRLKDYPVGVSESLEALDAFSVTKRKPSTCTAPQVPVASNSFSVNPEKKGVCPVFADVVFLVASKGNQQNNHHLGFTQDNDIPKWFLFRRTGPTLGILRRKWQETSRRRLKTNSRMRLPPGSRTDDTSHGGGGVLRLANLRPLCLEKNMGGGVLRVAKSFGVPCLGEHQISDIGLKRNQK